MGEDDVLHCQATSSHDTFHVLDGLTHLAAEIRRVFAISPHRPLSSYVQEVICHYTWAVWAGDNGARRSHCMDVGPEQQSRGSNYSITNTESAQNEYLKASWITRFVWEVDVIAGPATRAAAQRSP